MVASLVRGAKNIARRMYAVALPEPINLTYGELGQIFSALDDSETIKTYGAVMRELVVYPWDVVRKTGMSLERAEENLERLTELGLIRKHDNDQSPDHPVYSITAKGAHVSHMYLHDFRGTI